MEQELYTFPENLRSLRCLELPSGKLRVNCSIQIENQIHKGAEHKYDITVK
jgi:hypothetical protein